MNESDSMVSQIIKRRVIVGLAIVASFLPVVTYIQCRRVEIPPTPPTPRLNIDRPLCERLDANLFKFIKLNMTAKELDAILGPADRDQQAKTDLNWRIGSEFLDHFEQIGSKVDDRIWWRRSMGWYCRDSMIQVLFNEKGTVVNARYVQFFENTTRPQ